MPWRNGRAAKAVTLATAAVSLAAPIGLAALLARRQGVNFEEQRALSYAQDVLHRTTDLSAQVRHGLQRVEAVDPEHPCSPAAMAEMRDVDVGSSYVQAIGYITNNRLVCSSLGTHAGGLPLGPVDIDTRSGWRLRLDVALPFARDTRFLVMEDGHYAAVVHKALLLDASVAGDAASVAAFIDDSRGIVASRGFVRHAWLDGTRGTTRSIFIDSGFVVAVVRVSPLAAGALVALPVSAVNSRAQADAVVLIPIGTLVGLVLGFGVLRLARWHRSMPSVIRSALRNGEFHMVYEPIVDVRTGAWVGAEALIRWRRPNGEMIRPDLFIPVAEETGLIGRITDRVVSIVERESAIVRLQHPAFAVSINLSASDLNSGDILTRLSGLVPKHGEERRNLIVEVSERGVLQTDVAAAVIKGLRAEGITVAIDDFGTGYSCLAYLESLELDILKIDKAFIESIGTKAATSQVARHIIAMAEALDLDVIAEGVETDAQLQFLRERGVRYAQGWLFSRPMELSVLMSRLAEAQTHGDGRDQRAA